jgi:hypothetical protein
MVAMAASFSSSSFDSDMRMLLCKIWISIQYQKEVVTGAGLQYSG